MYEITLGVVAGELSLFYVKILQDYLDIRITKH